MEFMDGNLDKYIEKLKDNLFIKLECEEREKVENQLKQIEKISEALAKQIGANGIQLKFNEDTKISLYSELEKSDSKIGVIHCSRLFIIANYQMFYQMDFSNIVTDGKNIENIKMLMFDMSMMCMFFHEMAHIYRGHLELYSQWKKENSIERHTLDIQTLEWDADSFAATKMAEWIVGVNNNKEILQAGNTDFAMKIACGAIHGMMYWQRTAKDFNKIDQKEHPPVFYREASILKCITELMPDTKHIVRYVTGYEKEFNRVWGIKSKDIEHYFESSAENSEYMNRIEENWEKVKSKLQTYAVFPLDDK